MNNDNKKPSGINEELLLKVKNIFTKYPVEKAYLFGSRARGNFKTSSDIDLALEGVDLNSTMVNLIKDELEILNTPLIFDVVDIKSLRKNKLIENIREEGVIIYDRKK
jgi:hypothetical protein